MLDRGAGEGASFGTERLAQLVEALPVGVFILDSAGVAVYANAAAQALLGRAIIAGDHADNLGERFSAYVSDTDELYPVERMPIVRALSGERTRVDDMEIDRGGERIALEVTATPIFDEASRLVFAVAVFQDITPRRQAQKALALLNQELERQVERRTTELASTIAVLEQEIRTRKLAEEQLIVAKASAERANKAKSIFFMNVSHELRTPLNHIIGFNDLLSERIDDPKSRRLAETAGSSGRDLLEKINNLIELARADAQPSRAITTFDFDALLHSVAGAAGIRCEPVDRVGEIQGDEETIRHILSAVMQRAAAEDDGALLSTKIDSDRQPARVVISIQGQRLAARVRALATLFGETAIDDRFRFQQQEIDFGLAVARAEARMLGGDLELGREGDREVVQVVLLGS